MPNKYPVFVITSEDIQDAIKQTGKQLKSISEDDQEYKANRKSFNKMRKEIREHPGRHHEKIMKQVYKEFEEIEYKFHGRFFQVIENYMTSNGQEEKEE